MSSMELTIIQKISAYALPILFAITVHEAAHGYVARYFGDMTAHYMNRISLNPLRHIDPVGTVIFPALTLLVGGILFGWAKPVPVNFSNLTNPKKDMFWVALAGPAANLVMAIFWTILLARINFFPQDAELFMRVMCLAGIQINIVLMVLNLLPIPPLDGGRIAVSVLPHPWSNYVAGLERYGFFILIFLLVSGLLSQILMPLVRISQGIIFGIFG
jgi:Zn-dependent protease